MKATALIIISFLLFACAATSRPPVSHEVIIRVLPDNEQPLKVETGEKIVRTMEVDTLDDKLSNLTWVADDVIYMKIWAGISQSDLTSVWNDFRVLWHETTIRKVNVFFSSGGGQAHVGLALADELRLQQEKGFKLTAYARGMVASATVPVYAVCKYRVAAKSTVFMVHESKMFKWPGWETRSDIEAQQKMMNLNRELYLDILADNSNLSKDKWAAMEDKTTWFSAQEAKEWGLVDRIE